LRNLFNFIVKNVHWLLFFLLIFFSVLLIVKNNQFQRSKFLSATQEMTGSIYSVSSSFQSYMNLNSANADLLKRVAELETELYTVKRTLELSSDSVQTENMKLDSATVFIYQFLPARVVNSTVLQEDNYLTIDKGSDDGIEEDMGVISENGIVGVIMKTSPHFSIVIPILNSKFKLSCKVRYNNYIGPLVWDGKDSQYTYLTELPRHVDFAAGDTIVTSGYSAVFPEGLPVGSIVSFLKQRDDNYTSLKVRLFTNFNTLRNVLIIKNKYQKEQRRLQETINQ